MSNIPDLLVFDRRYSAIAFCHPKVNKISTFLKMVDSDGFSELDGSPDHFGEWTTHRCTTRSIAYKTSGSKEVGYGLSWFVARRKIGERVVFVIASPYLSILEKFARSLQEGLADPAPEFIRPDLLPIFALLRDASEVKSDGEAIRATRLSLRLAANHVDLVSLSGPSPLISDLYLKLTGGTLEAPPVPYDIRLQLSRRPSQPFRFYMTRLGRFHFNLHNMTSFNDALKCFDFFLNRNLYVSSFKRPMLRETGD
jgi:hypothetical protein